MAGILLMLIAIAILVIWIKAVIDFPENRDKLDCENMENGQCNDEHCPFPCKKRKEKP